VKPRTQEELDAFFCDVHSDRHGNVRVDLPSIGLQRVLCDECSDSLTASLSAPVPSYKPNWRNDPKYDERLHRDDIPFRGDIPPTSFPKEPQPKKVKS